MEFLQLDMLLAELLAVVAEVVAYVAAVLGDCSVTLLTMIGKMSVQLMLAMGPYCFLSVELLLLMVLTIWN